MPRPSRREEPGALHHVVAKSPSRRLLFNDDGERQRYLQLLAGEIRIREWRLLTFCLLSNHLHLLIQTPQPDLGAGMKVVHETFARRTNHTRREGGSLFGARFYSTIVRNDRHALGCLRYIARNPVEAFICPHARDWPWSAHRALAGICEAPSFLDLGAAYDHLGRNANDARANYVRLVAMSNSELLADLAQPHSDQWLVDARNDFAIPLEDLMAYLRLGRSATYERLSAVRRTVESVP